MSESQPMSADPLDRLLTVSLKAQPEATPIPDLAQRALRRAGALDRMASQQRRRLTIHRWRVRLVYCAAAMLIGLLILFGGHRLLNERQSMSSTDDSNSSTDSITSTTSSTGTYVAWLGGLVFICTLAGLAAEGAISNERQSLLV